MATGNHRANSRVIAWPTPANAGDKEKNEQI
jgi:hypothetical protein